MPDRNTMVVAYHQPSGQRREVPEHWLGDSSPFPGQWSTSAPDKTGAAEAPAKNASKDAWVDYALNNGATPDSLEGKSRDEIAAEFAPNVQED